ncbi:MAG: hypothetical protein M3Z96_03515 [Pseudomonadota bacterium]|nr:hypothetical protein [Pseudomonadota bacterium]
MNMKHYPRLRKFGLFNLRKDFPMKKLTFALSFAPIAFSGTAMADPQWSGSTVSIVNIEVDDVSANGAGPARIFLRFNAAPLSTPCSLISNNDWQVGGSADNIKNIMTLATSAKLAGKPVKVLWNQGASNQCSAGGTTGYPVIIGLQANTECGCGGANPIP